MTLWSLDFMLKQIRNEENAQLHLQCFFWEEELKKISMQIKEMSLYCISHPEDQAAIKKLTYLENHRAAIQDNLSNIEG